MYTAVRRADQQPFLIKHCEPSAKIPNNTENIRRELHIAAKIRADIGELPNVCLPVHDSGNILRTGVVKEGDHGLYEDYEGDMCLFTVSIHVQGHSFSDVLCY